MGENKMISVLMSVYNETLKEIQQSIDSILSQSYKDFELIVVLDKPEYTQALELLNKYAEADDRVVVVVNNKNIGLAMSMNVAAEKATGEYLLRMDADDICMPDRFEIEYKAICDGNYDLLCSSYEFIDENGNEIKRNVHTYTGRQIKLLLPHTNVIHHPTVIMKADKFRALGGYRNYKCAQDYDLWLRMKNAGYSFCMLPEKLIKYRVRSSSVTVQQRYKQICTLNYIRMLYKNKDSMSGYSYEEYLNYLKQNEAETDSANKDFSDNFNKYQNAKKKLKKGKLIAGIIDLRDVFFRSKYYKPNVARIIYVNFVTKFIR